MKLHTIDTGLFKLDGGAMFGVVPKTIWQNLNPADGNNMCSWAMRCLLIEEGDQLILVDTGIGNKQDAKFFSHYYLHGEDNLLNSIHKKGFSEDDITDVVLTHLHFDHVGGAVAASEDRARFFTQFRNAIYWTDIKHWEWAIHPNPREKASFLKENLLPLQESGQLNFIRESAFVQNNHINFISVNGHTEAMLLPKIQIGGKTVVYLADLIPSSAHLPLPYVMSYDVRPLLTMEEKSNLLKEAAENNWILFFEHDPVVECATVIQTEKGVRIMEKGKLIDFI